MVDNVTLPGNASVIASDDIGGVHYQRIKVGFGADGFWVTASAGGGNKDTGTLRVAIADDDTNLAAMVVDLAAIEVLLTTIAGDTTSLDGKDFATETTLLAIAGYLDGVETLLGTIDADTGNMSGYLATLAGAVGGTEVQVDIVEMPGAAAEASALPSLLMVVAGDDGIDTHPLQVDANGSLKVVLQAGTAAVGKLAANSGVDIGDVDVTSVADQYDGYETVAASQTAQTLGATGATGDFIAGILCIPASLSPGNVILLDNATSITVFAGGTDSLLTLHPFFIPLNISSVSGAWKITTGANVSCIAMGRFT